MKSSHGTSPQGTGTNPVPGNLCAILQAEKQFVCSPHRNGFHFTVDTLAILTMRFPLAGTLRTFTFKNNVRAGRTELLGN